MEDDVRLANLLRFGAFIHGAGRLAVIGAFLSYWFDAITSDALVWIAIGGVAVSLIGAIPYRTALRRSFPKLGRDLFQFECCVCPNCGYILRGESRDPLECSECGESYSRAELKDIWTPFIAIIPARS